MFVVCCNANILAQGGIFFPKFKEPVVTKQYPVEANIRYKEKVPKMKHPRTSWHLTEREQAKTAFNSEAFT